MPPAESPSTKNSSLESWSWVVQSISLPGRPPPESTLLRLRTSSRALRAASRASAASCALAMIRLAAAGVVSRNSPSRSLTTRVTIPSTSALASLILVWLSNCGSGTLTLTIAASPSRKSSPVIVRSLFLAGAASLAYWFSVRVRAVRNPVKCVPPSIVWMLLQYETTISLIESLYCKATSTSTPRSSSRPISTIGGCKTVWARFK